MQELTQELVRNLFTYKDGFLYWKVYRTNSVKIGDKAGTLNNIGYYRIKINNKIYLSHRLIFLYHHGYLPKYIDHIDSNKLNNNISNLREVTCSQNGMNRKSNKNSSSKYKGVCWHKQTQKWCTHIAINGKDKHIGYFISETEAALAYNDAAIKYFDEYAKLNEV